MKIIVDSVPKKSSECMFSEYDYGRLNCRLDREMCCLEHNEKCDKLIGLQQINSLKKEGKRA